VIDSNLVKQPLPLERNLHRARRLNRRPDDLARCAGALNASFVSVSEFADVCREFAIVFVPAGQRDDGQGVELAPMAVFGLQPGENLMLDAQGRWSAHYVPAVLRTHPFALGALDSERLALCIDDAYGGWSDTEGQPLFEPDGQPTALTREMQQFLERFEADVQRTRLFCRRVADLQLLRSMRFDATLPDGNTIGVDGFWSLDEEKFAALPDATVVELHRNGVLGLLHAHHLSLGQMRLLVERRLARRATA
jgi:hypothetical protein